MHASSPPDIESELGYAYLHAVATKAGMSCHVGNRHEDNAGIDAVLTAWGPFPGAYLTEVDLKVQLKATINRQAEDEHTLSYFVKGKQRYNDLCTDTVAIPRILVVLFLPREQSRWLHHDVDALILRECAYWVSLRGATRTNNDTGATVKLPKTQVFSPDNLRQLMVRLSHRDFPRYQEAR